MEKPMFEFFSDLNLNDPLTRNRLILHLLMSLCVEEYVLEEGIGRD